VTGWVRNRRDDSVEAMLQGSLPQVIRMCEWMRDDAPWALVKEIDVTEVELPCPAFDRFEQQPTV
jgi:acylphosphatase